MRTVQQKAIKELMDKYEETEQMVSKAYPHLPDNLIAAITDDIMTANIERIGENNEANS